MHEDFQESRTKVWLKLSLSKTVLLNNGLDKCRQRKVDLVQNKEVYHVNETD